MPSLRESFASDDRESAVTRAIPRPVFPSMEAGYTTREVERIWFSAKTVSWKLVADNIDKGWDIAAGLSYEAA